MYSNFYHRTNNLDAILRSGKVMSLKHLARSTPEVKVSVEPGASGSNLGGLSSSRETLDASDAYDRMRDVKDVDNIFLTKDTVLPESSGYGKYIIEKSLKAPTFNDKINLIANEYKHGRALSVKNNSTVYVPDEELVDIKDRHPNINIRPVSEIEAKTSTLVDTARTLLVKTTGIGKQADLQTLYSGSERDIKKILSPNATIVGSEGIGINLEGSSDRDILVPYKTNAGYNRLVNKLKEDNLGLQESIYNDRKRDGFKVYTYKDNNVDIDVALVRGGKAPELANHVRKLRSELSDERKKEIINTKQKLQNAWFFKDYRYKKYKRGIDKELGLTEFHE